MVHSRVEQGRAAGLPFADGLASARRARLQAMTVWGVASLWLLLTGWCVHLLLHGRTLRSEIEERVSWIDRAEELRRRVSELPAMEEAPYRFPPELREELLAGRIRHEAPLPPGYPDGRWPWQQAAERVVAAADRLEGKDPRDPALAADMEALHHGASSFDQSVSWLTAEVRAELAALSEALERNWETLYILAAFFLGALGALGLGLRRWRAKADQVRMREHHFRTLVQTAQDLIWSVDAEGRWSFVNEASRRIYGHAPEEMVGRPVADFVEPGHLQQEQEHFRRVLEGETRLHYETVHERCDGERVVLLCNATPMLDGRGRVRGAMGSATDVTELRTIQEGLLLNERLQAVATLGGGVAHDFNNLLTVIIGQAQVAMAKEKLSSQLSRRLASILETAERARKLTQQLLAFARRQPARPETIDLVAVIRQMGDLLRNLVGTGIRVQEILSPEPVRIRGDWGQVDQVIMNFVLNARDAMPQGGTVTIGVQPRSLSAGEGRMLGIPAGDWAMLEVADTGVGISADVLPRIFEPFFTTKEPGKGTGLGLASVYAIVHQHGGTVIARSTLGSGTCMQVYLPLVREGAERDPAGTAVPVLAAAGER